ncbi:glycosyltransferase family 2 protein [Crocosphaera chwakensis]|uniref:Glycosyl transferase n=1 Tax=Crocosphaera chwakensis CCY0110 TaxID=391612 RepID=A3IKY0_9CHRO|nr:glycosyltransferase [Crocosphaera chwakensis]EAZ92849.1 glycosyl transferase [Crocosphaera chwakensis CCY0110]
MSVSPFISIVIPTYNRPERLKTCLESISCLYYPQEHFEVIIVDDGSKEPLNSAVEPYQNLLNITLIRQTNAGPAKARNTGANAATGQYLAFTDDDCTLDKNWLLALENSFSKTSNALLGGKTINALPDNLYSSASQLLIDYLYDYYNQKSAQATFFASNNFALSRDLFEKVGQFDVTFPLAAGEDREFCDRWLFQGYSLHYVPEAIIYHSHHLSLAKFWRQHFNYGCGAYYFHQVRSQRNQTSVKVEPLDFYWKLLTYPLTANSQQSSKLFLCTLLFLSQFANVYGFFISKLKQ